MKCTVDRIENGIAVLIMHADSPERINVPFSQLPSGSREGDVLILTLERDPAATLSEKEGNAWLIEKMKKK